METKVQEEMSQQHDEPAEDPQAMYNQNVAGRPAEVFSTVCNLKCPEHEGPDGEPTPETCAQFICPTLRQCVVGADGLAGDWDRFMGCFEHLDKAREGDEFDAAAEEEAREEFEA